jgi:hypothetical protein
MTNKRKLGIWMCQSRIHMIEYNNETPVDLDKIPCLDNTELNTSLPIESFSAVQKAEIFKKQQVYKKMATQIAKYDEVILFGPLDTKLEFQKYLQTNADKNTPSIEIKQTENMTEAEQVAFVQFHFLHHNRTNA